MEPKQFIAFMIIASISITCHIVSVFVFLHFGSQDAVTTKIVCMLHISSLIQNIASLPDIYLGNPSLCQFMGAMHYVGGLGIVSCVILLSVAFYHFLTESEKVLSTLKKGRIAVLLFPAIAFLPLTTDSYSEVAGSWCTLNNDTPESGLWALCIFYFWACLALLLSTFAFLYVIINTYAYGIPIRGKLFATLGAYILCSWIYLVPRLYIRFVLFFGATSNNTGEYLGEILAYVCGIVFSIISYCSRDIFRDYERHLSNKSDRNRTLSLGNWQSALNSIVQERFSGSTSVLSGFRLSTNQGLDVESIHRRSSETVTTTENPCIKIEQP
jgi:hypothetical protein